MMGYDKHEIMIIFKNKICWPREMFLTEKPIDYELISHEL